MLEVLEPGALSSVQDLGRPDAVSLGVPQGGACDRWSLRVANALAGNDPAAPALEVTLAGPHLRVARDCLVGLAGADLDARIIDPAGETKHLPPGASCWLSAGQLLVFGVAGERTGIRAYLALAGGLDVPRVLGSASTCLVGRFGGLAGRTLVAGDSLRSADPHPCQPPARLRSWPGSFRPEREATRRALRIVPGPHLDRLPPRILGRLLATEYRISPRADRQGIVLDGPRLPSRPGAADGRMLSQGMTWGSVQLPPDGRPICLLADHGTVGGYPVAAVVISADLPLLGQLGPGDPLSFREVSLEEAIAALGAQESEWRESLDRLSREAG